ncbi:MAG TPA: TonB-dependent receptor [Flavitalea sp.]|nr:TonB-dependent receptor [Flavitalea sp.]
MRKLILTLHCILMLCILTPVNAQTGRQIKGSVLSEDRLPLAGVTVAVKESNLKVLTDDNGNFSIQLPAGHSVLQFSYVGYQDQELQVDHQNALTILLARDIKSFDDVVVIGYGTVKKSDITGSISSVKAADLKSLPVQRVDQALQGRAAGVFVQNTDASPGGNTKIRVRGMNSITGGNNALIVIDGQQGGNINLLNPNDIESIEILKDASATAIYGAKGANGVILITTKTGKSGKPEVAYSFNYGVQKISHELDVMSAKDFIANVNANAALNNSVGTPPPVFTESQVKMFENNPGVNWQDVIYQVAPMQSHSLSISGGTDQVKYFFSAGYLNQKGIVVNSDYNRFNVRGNLKSDFNKWISAGVNVAFVRSIGNVPPFGEKGSAVTDLTGQPIVQAPLWDPTIPIYDSAGNYSRHPNNYGDPFSANPLAALLETSTKNVGTENIINGYLDFKILSGLTLRIMGSGNFSTANNRRFFNDKTLAGRVIDGAAGLGILETNKNDLLQNTNILTYDKSFNKHHLTFTGVAEQQIETNQSTDTRVQGFTTMETALDDIGSAKNIIANSGAFKRSLNSFLGRINYSFDNKYLITASYRADGSSVFGENNKWGYFPSMAFAWRLSEETFVKSLDIFSDLKLRASWGIVGNQAISPYQSLSALSSGRNYPFNGTSQLDYGFQITQAANPNLKWESTTQKNIGLDLGFFNNRLLINVDVFKKNTNDLLLYRTLAGYTGLPSIIDNVGSTENKGLELLISGDPLIGDVKWNTSFNISWNRNKVIDLGTTTKLGFISSSGNYGVSNLMYLVPGEPFGQMYGYGTQGLWKESESAEAYKYGQLPGEIHYVDVNNDGEIDLLDQMVIGQALPKYIFGWSNRITYKGFDLNFLFQGVKGNNIFNMAKIRLESPGSGTSNRLLNRWTPQNQNTDIPAFIDDQTRLNAQLTDKINISDIDVNALKRFVEDGSYTRLKNVIIGYTLNPHIINRLGLNRIRVFASATNLLTITNYTGYDPEVSSYNENDAQVGIDMGNYPSAKTYTIGLDVIF